MKRFLPAIAACLLLLGAVLAVGPDLSPYVPSIEWFSGKPTRAVIVRETGLTAPLTTAQVEVFQKAPSIGVAVWDQNDTGPNRGPLKPQDKAIIDAAIKQPLPVLVLEYPSGRLVVKPCPDLDGLRKAVGL